jgi:hypothetical protein
MSALQKIFKENSVSMVVAILLIGYGVYYYTSYLSMKGSSGSEYMNGNTNKAYVNNNNVNGDGASVQPAMPQGQNEVYSSANGIQTSMPGAPSTCNTANIQNPSELLPKDKNSQWAQLNPSGKGELANVNLLRAGYHIGIDTIGQSLRNANLQIRSEPPNPQLYVGPWNQTTIEPDFMRPPLEIGAGGAQ